MIEEINNLRKEVEDLQHILSSQKFLVAELIDFPTNIYKVSVANLKG